jgi:hypothetical protein
MHSVVSDANIFDKGRSEISHSARKFTKESWTSGLYYGVSKPFLVDVKR